MSSTAGPEPHRQADARIPLTSRSRRVPVARKLRASCATRGRGTPNQNRAPRLAARPGETAESNRNPSLRSGLMGGRLANPGNAKSVARPATRERHRAMPLASQARYRTRLAPCARRPHCYGAPQVNSNRVSATTPHPMRASAFTIVLALVAATPSDGQTIVDNGLDDRIEALNAVFAFRSDLRRDSTVIARCRIPTAHPDSGVVRGL